MTSLGRRKFLVTSASATLAASLATLGRPRTAVARGPWGELVEDPDGILDLPEGFSYTILEDAGQMMDDGYRVPGRPDGMACFAGPDDTLILLRNHENSLDDLPNGPYNDGQDPPPEAYDPQGMGGVSRLVVDATTFERVSSNLVLAGTVRNCAGGPSPWGWLSCEENVEINGEFRHGYTFLCEADADAVAPAQVIPAYGRFYHEAVCIDPSNNVAYLTEDRINSCFYRFVPDDMDDPFGAGSFQALKVVGMDGYNTIGMGQGEVLDVEWVDIDEPDPDDDTLREEAADKGAAIIVRGEGIWFFEGQIYICATFGGPIMKGQIFRLIDGDSPTLELVVVSDDAGVLNNPDNITVAPWGHVYMVEDNGGVNHVRMINDAGEVCDFARNVGPSELAGICFSPLGDAMFFNIQTNGLTVVVTGPFQGEEPGDGDGDPGGDGDGDPATGDGDGDATTTGDEDTEGGTEGDTGGGDPGGAEDGEGCGCATDEGNGLGAVATVAAAVGVAVITRKPGEDSI